MPDHRKIFGIGLSRTGTTSLTQALLMLNIRSLHWPTDELTRRELEDYFEDRSRPLVLSVAEFYQGLTDTPVVAVYRELSRIYPDSRFVLTLRDEEEWLASCQGVWATAVRQQYQGDQDPGFARYCRRVNTEVYGTPDFDRERFRQVYRRHQQEVRSWFADEPARLLIHPVGAGWPPLCAFLDRPEPSRTYPHLNRFGNF